jgi:aminopeptidase N
MKKFGLMALIFLGLTVAQAQRELGVRPTDSGGVLMPEQAAYDVKSYDLNLRVDIENKSIKGVATTKALLLKPTDKFVLDLDTTFTVESVKLLSRYVQPLPLKFERREGKIWINFHRKVEAGVTAEVQVIYSGKPRVAPRPPWVGGFVWSKTADGSPWVGVAVQNDGADLWFPVKDHPSDEAESVSLHFTVPQNLTAASNGKLQSVVKNNDGTHTFNWFVSQPINNYNINLNIAPYKVFEDKMKSVAGDEIPIVLYVLPENADRAQWLIDETQKYVQFFEEHLGPYPFRSEKLGIAQTPYLGMEHQTIIAYGSNFQPNQFGFDWLMFHELGHEWWGNLVTASDWKDFWLHEGFQSYFDTLYVERVKGKDEYMKQMIARQKATRNSQPVAPREPRMAYQMYMTAPDYLNSDGDIYGKGAAVLHTLRYLIGDEAFFKSLRRMAYPDPKMERVKDGRQTRLTTTDEFIRIAEKESGMELDWFFDVYVRQPKLPRLTTQTAANQINFAWEVPNSLSFLMPVEVKVGQNVKRYEKGRNSVAVPADQSVLFDPNGWILKAQ